MANSFQKIGRGMIEFFRIPFLVVTFPFRVIFNAATFPFRMARRFHVFLNSEPEERPLAEALSDLITDGDVRAQAMDHLWSLRRHLIRSVASLAAAIVGAFFFTTDLMEYLAAPVGGLEKLQAIQVTEEIGVFMRVAMTAGIAVSFPYIAFELWWFAAAGGLKSWEKKIGLAGIPLATFLFLLGMAFTFYVMLPAALPFLGSFTAISQFWAAREYFAFVTGLMLWIGAFFEFPLVIFILSFFGLVQPKFLAEQWRLAVVIIAVAAAAITPTVDPVNMALVMAPMILLYFVSIGLSSLAHAMRRKRTAEPAVHDVELG